MRAILIILMLFAAGCSCTGYANRQKGIYAFRCQTLIDSKMDQGRLRLPDGARFDLSGQSSQSNAEAVGTVAGAAARVLIGAP